MQSAFHKITGRVVHASGKPAGNAGVSIVRSSVPLPESFQNIDGAGNFRMNLPAGTFVLEAISSDGTSRKQATINVPAQTSVEITLDD